MIAGAKILPEKTLMIFDEIQECPEALNSLKYFKEKANEYHVVAAGSLLGTLLARPKSYPVGMVNLLDLYPLSFDEFLDATDPVYQRQSACTRSAVFKTRLQERWCDHESAVVPRKKDKRIALRTEKREEKGRRKGNSSSPFSSPFFFIAGAA